MKRAQNRVDEYLLVATSDEAGVILPIHDELIIEWPRKRLGEAKGCLREVVRRMVDFPMFSVPFEVDVQVSTREWPSKKPFSLGG